MLKGIDPVLSPELLAVLCRMGHGDELVLADAHFPAESVGRRVLRADGVRIPRLLRGILPLFELDDYGDAPLIMMAAVPGDVLDLAVEVTYREAMAPHLAAGAEPAVARLGRFAFYERARAAFALVVTGELAKYGNLILRKGVTPAD
ncbi:MAG: L-fucose mutarotase [Verrucomicrobiota bacterium]